MNSRRPGVLVHSGCYNRITQTGWLIYNRNLFLTVLEAGNSKIKVPADSVSGRSQGNSCILTVPSHGGSKQ